jgi:hemoglobin-like flavoprotein
MTATNPIERSFELAAERCEDLTPLVYRRLFREHPEAEAMFRTEGSALVKGSMLALTIDAILDFARALRRRARS